MLKLAYSKLCGVELAGRHQWFPVGVYAIILFLHVGGQWFVIMPWWQWQLDSWSRRIWFGIFNLGAIMIYWTYWLCCFREPGYVPLSDEVDDEPAPDAETMATSTMLSEQINLRKDSSVGKSEMCRKCSSFKPPRAHHCSVCKRCVMRFDHHCPWINNCVGYGNQRHFIRFLVFVSVMCTLLMFTFFYRIVDLAVQMDLDWKRNGKVSERHMTVWQLLWFSTVTFVDLLVMVSVSILCIYQLYYMCINCTNVENIEKDKVRSHAKRHGFMFHYPYDMGFMANIKSILGNNKWLWLWPLQTAHGDGIHYEISRHSVDELNEWPPQWYKEIIADKHRDHAYDDDDDESGSDDLHVSAPTSDDDRPLEQDGTALQSKVKRKYGQHVRRGSEGYEVRYISMEGRMGNFHE